MDDKHPYGEFATREALASAVLLPENVADCHRTVAKKYKVTYSMIQRIRTPPPAQDRRYNISPLMKMFNDHWICQPEEVMCDE